MPLLVALEEVALEYSVVKGVPHFVECMVVALALQVTPLVLACKSVIMEEILALRDLFKATIVVPNPQVPLSFLHYCHLSTDKRMMILPMI